jgi:SAM-dependent methyltransferase
MAENYIKESVIAHYDKLAEETSLNKSFGKPLSCCGASSEPMKEYTAKLGYTTEELNSIPSESMLGLGCGNPLSLLQIKEGDVVLDLGSGSGFDSFLAAKKVGKSGRVIGVDLSNEMVQKAIKIATKYSYNNLEFRIGDIESLPVEDNSIDLIISNCVINLATNKNNVYKEAFRVLKPGGRVSISDIVSSCKLPERIKNDLELYKGCMAGCSTVDEVRGYLESNGFVDIRINVNASSRDVIKEWAPTENVVDYLASALIQAKKPEQKSF